MFPDLTVAEKAKNGHSVQARTEESPLFDTPSFISNFLFPIGQYADTVPAWSYYPTLRDAYLRAFWKTEPKLRGAVYSMVAFGKSLDLQLDGLPRAKKYSQTVLQDCENGLGQRALIGKSLVDFFTQDNGMFWELIGRGRADKPLRGALLPPYVMHMDSANCWRTFDEEFPVLYRNPIDGTYHKMHRTRVLYRANNEQPDELARGIGFCPVSGVLREAQNARDILIYRHEKVSGRFTRAIGYGVGLNAKTLVDSLKAADEAAESEGFAIYKGIPFVTRAQGAMDLKLLDLASVPDGFDLDKETQLYMYILALNFGVDAREFWPASQSGATKADATIQDMKTQGKGKGDVIETLESMWRQVFPDTVEAEYDYTDDEQDLRKAQIYAVHTTNFGNLQKGATIDVEEARAHLVKHDVLDVALLKASAPQEMNAEEVTDSTPVEDEQNNAQGNSEERENEKPSEEGEQLAAKEFLILDVKKKELNATRAAFDSSFNNVLEGAIARDYARSQAERLLYRLVRRYGTNGYIDGMNDGGVEISESELERDDIRIINRLLGVQQGYISDFMAVVYGEAGLTPAVASGKAEQWFNGSIMPFYYAGLEQSGSDPMMEFVGDDGAKPCRECRALKGQRHRLSEWIERGFNPPDGINISCSGGKHCKHRLERVRGRARGSWVVV